MLPCPLLPLRLLPAPTTRDCAFSCCCCSAQPPAPVRCCPPPCGIRAWHVNPFCCARFCFMRRARFSDPVPHHSPAHKPYHNPHHNPGTRPHGALLLAVMAAQFCCEPPPPPRSNARPCDRAACCFWSWRGGGPRSIVTPSADRLVARVCCLKTRAARSAPRRRRSSQTHSTRRTHKTPLEKTCDRHVAPRRSPPRHFVPAASRRRTARCWRGCRRCCPRARRTRRR